MKKIHINYADKSYYQAQKVNSQSALDIAKVDGIIQYSRANLDDKFINKNSNILNQPRGAGYWLWKPYIINKTLDLVDDGDIVFYTDSGSNFINPCQSLYDKVLLDKNQIILFELNSNHTNRNWVKRDCFYYLNLDSEDYANKVQILASFVILVKNEFTKKFVAEWLHSCEDYRVITDSPNECGLPNYNQFMDHRHDQSVLSLLGRKHNITTMPDISQFGSDRLQELGQLINHTRSRG